MVEVGTCGGMAARWRRRDEGSTFKDPLVDGMAVLVLSLRRCCDRLGEEQKGKE